MKIVCPKCQAAYRVDLPDPGGVSAEVQCGKCLSIFLFTPDLEQSSSSVNQREILDQTAKASDLTENRPAEPIVPPQKDEEQEFSGQKDPDFSPRNEPSFPPETPEELAIELLPEDPEVLKIIIDEDPPDDSLEEQVLDEIWNKAVEEGTREERKAPKKSPAPRANAPEQQDRTPTWEEAFADEVQVETKWRREQEKARIQEEQQLAEALGVPYTPPEPTPIEELVTRPPTENRQDSVDRWFAEAQAKIDQKKKTPSRQRVHRLPTMRERQRDIDITITRHRSTEKGSEGAAKHEKSLPLPSMDERQREIDDYIRSQRTQRQAPESKTPEESKPVPPPGGSPPECRRAGDP